MEDAYPDPIEQFKQLLDKAKHTGLREPTAMSLATADREGNPMVRTVLLKAVDQRGFVFFTNYNSRKGRQLTNNPRASLCFFWQSLFEQVLVDGTVEQVADEEADAYWVSRPRDSQLAAWASEQSEPLEDRASLERRVVEYRNKFTDQPIPRPPHWSGFRVVPERIEFWRSGWSRLHERICYERKTDGWSVSLLNP